MKNGYKPVKRGLDILGALALMMVLSPLFLLIMLAIAVDSEGNVLFPQSRMGRNGRPFIIFKFRTMYLQTPTETPTGALSDPERFITPVGRFLRRTSLDELPQLFNILKGDMSFIGPRPVVLAERQLLSLRRDKGADSVRPGITGLAQVRGRDEVSIRAKAGYDAFYARRMSPALDAWIFWRTFRCVFTGEGIREGAPKPSSRHWKEPAHRRSRL